MKTDNKFTQRLQEFMNKPDSEKDWAEGAILLLQLTGNQIMYRNISVNPKGKAEFIKGTLQKHLNFRLAQLTHDEVNQMQAQVDEIVTKVIKPADQSNFAEFKAGKRPDHDSLPDSIQALYTENLNIVHKMRELHLRLRTLSTESTTCPDSDRYPFLKELITLDKQLRALIGKHTTTTCSKVPQLSPLSKHPSPSKQKSLLLLQSPPRRRSQRSPLVNLQRTARRNETYRINGRHSEAAFRSPFTSLSFQRRSSSRPA